MLALWAAVGIAGIAAMQWGVAQVSGALTELRGRIGIGGIVAGALLGLATATPEISVNVASVVFGWPDIGLGAALGSNVPALPLIFLIAWLSLRVAVARRLTPERPVVAPAAASAQALPYLAIVLLLAALTLPPAWAGLQPIDAGILAAAWACYFVRVLPRPEHPVRTAEATLAAGLPVRALIGVPAIALGALASVIAARRLGAGLGAPDMVVGLFAIGLLCAVPESLAAWSLARQGRTTTAVATGMGDGIVSLTLGLVAPALAGAKIGNVPIYVANLVFLTAVLVAYLGLNRVRQGQELGLARVSLFGGAYAVYLGAVAYLLAA
jgi:cation:H+ antiporter